MEYTLDKLNGYTIVVSGGTVNKKGENKDQNSIYVAEGEIVVIEANEYEGYTFFQWFSDSVEVIPTSTFELYVTRDTYFYICFEEGLDYGDWTLEKEPTCTEIGIYSRIDLVTGLKQYAAIPCRGWHNTERVEQDQSQLTCTDKVVEIYKCLDCDYEEVFEYGELGHDFSGHYEIIEEAYGSKVGLKAIKCTRCEAVKTKEYIKAAYPEGNIRVDFTWDHRSYVSSADRTEIHWQLDSNKYCFYVMRESSGHSSGNYVHFYFYYEDNGPHSPVYIKKMIGDKYNMQYDKYGSYGWGIVGYVDSFDDFIEYIDSELKGNDNGLNNSGLHTVYTMWEDIFNQYGGIPSSYYIDGIVEYCGYTCTIYTNGNFYYYVTEDNCCLSYGGLGSNRDQAWVSNITEIDQIPYGPVDFDSVYYIMIDISDGSDGKFSDQYYFQVENLKQKVEITESSYISKRKDVVGYEVKLLDGSWMKIEELVQNGTKWSGNDEFTYLSIIEKYFNGTYPDCLEIRAILEDVPLPVHVKVVHGFMESTTDSTQYGTDNNFLAFEDVLLIPDYDGSKYYIDCWRITINGETIEYREEYIWSYVLELPESGEVVAECVLVEFGSVEDSKVRVSINVIGEGSVNKESGEYSEFDLLNVIANAPKGKVFVGWFVSGLYLMLEGDMDMPTGSFDETYYDYGEYWGNSPVYNFNLYERYDEIVITAIFEDIDLSKDYIDILVTDGFVGFNSQTSIYTSALRLAYADYLSIQNFPKYEEISSWIVTEQIEGEQVVTELEGSYSGYYFENDAVVNPVFVTE